MKTKDEIPKEFKGKFDNWVFGCDICQDVCPWNNKFSTETRSNNFISQNVNKEIEFNEIIGNDSGRI